MGCATSIQALLSDRVEAHEDANPRPAGREAKAGRPGPEAGEPPPHPLHADRPHPHTPAGGLHGADVRYVPPPLPGLPGTAPLKTKKEDDALDYVPPLSPRRVQEIERWLESLPAPSEVPRSDRFDLLGALPTETHRLGAGSGESADEPPATTVTLDQLQHTHATSSDGTGIPARRQSTLDSADEGSSPLRMETSNRLIATSSRASIARQPPADDHPSPHDP
eukprot:EG_transcript_26754